MATQRPQKIRLGDLRDAVNRCIDGVTTISEAIRMNNLLEE